MRYDKVIYFCTNSAETYNETTGDYEAGEPDKVERYAAVLDMSEQRMNLVYGKIKQGALVIHLQNAYTDPFDYIEYNGRKYVVDAKREMRVKGFFTVSEVQK